MLPDLELGRGDGRYAKLMKSLAKIEVLVLDDLGIAPLTERSRRDLLELMDDRYNTRSTVVTSQLPVAQWHDAIGDPTLAGAILDLNQRVRLNFSKFSSVHVLSKCASAGA